MDDGHHLEDNLGPPEKNSVARSGNYQRFREFRSDGLRKKLSFLPGKEAGPSFLVDVETIVVANLVRCEGDSTPGARLTQRRREERREDSSSFGSSRSVFVGQKCVIPWIRQLVVHVAIHSELIRRGWPRQVLEAFRRKRECTQKSIYLHNYVFLFNVAESILHTANITDIFQFCMKYVKFLYLMMEEWKR